MTSCHSYLLSVCVCRWYGAMEKASCGERTSSKVATSLAFRNSLLESMIDYPLQGQEGSSYLFHFGLFHVFLLFVWILCFGLLVHGFCLHSSTESAVLSPLTRNASTESPKVIFMHCSFSFFSTVCFSQQRPFTSRNIFLWATKISLSI